MVLVVGNPAGRVNEELLTCAVGCYSVVGGHKKWFPVQGSINRSIFRVKTRSSVLG